MLYIHELRHLTPRMADLESVHLMRELKQKTPYPFTPLVIENVCTEFFVSPTAQEAVQQARFVLPEVAMQLRALSKDTYTYEQINVERALRIIADLELPLQQNLRYLEEMLGWQSFCIEKITPVLNAVPNAQSSEQKAQLNEQLKKIFAKLLRNEEFALKHHDLINEACVAHITGLAEGMEKGFLIRISIEDEIKKLSAAALKNRLPAEEAEKLDELQEKISLLKKGVDKAYASNLHLVNYAVVLYTYVKWVSSAL